MEGHEGPGDAPGPSLRIERALTFEALHRPSRSLLMKRHFVRASLLVGLLAAPLAAQGSISDPVLRRIWSLGMDSSRVWDLSQTFFDSIGPRLSGTPEGISASDWVMKNYRAWGIDARREQYGTWRGWKRGYSHIDMIKPRVRSLEAITLGNSPGTNGQNVVGSTIILPMVADSNEFVKWLPAVKGKFVLISAAICSSSSAAAAVPSMAAR